MGFLSFLKGEKPTKEKFVQVERFTPQQKQILNQILGQAGGMMPSGMGFLESILGQSPEAMQQFQAPARRAFEEQTIPTIAERFTGMGAQRSSAFPQILGQAGAGLEEALSAQRAGLGFQGLGQLQSLLGMGMTPQFETGIRPGTPGRPGFLEGLVPGLGKGIGMLPSTYMMSNAMKKQEEQAGQAGGAGGAGDFLSTFLKIAPFIL